MSKYKYSDASLEEQKAFGEGLNELLNKLSLALTLGINKTPVSIKLENGESKNVFSDEPTLILQHKTEVIEEESIKSPFVEQKNEPIKEN